MRSPSVPVGAAQLLRMLETTRIPVKPSYNPAEVRAILEISERTLHRMTQAWCPDPRTGELPPNALDSYLTPGGHRRVRHDELARYLRENRYYERTCR